MGGYFAVNVNVDPFSCILLLRYDSYTKSLPRTVQKAPKIYFFDNADVIGDEGARFENLMASRLLKRIHFLEDSVRVDLPAPFTPPIKTNAGLDAILFFIDW